MTCTVLHLRCGKPVDIALTVAKFLFYLIRSYLQTMQQNVDLLIILTCLDYIISDSLDQWFSSFHQPSPPSKFNWRIITVIYRVIYRVMQYHGRATYSEGLCSWPPENRSVAPKGGQESRLRNYGLDILNHSATSLLLGHALTKLNNS